MHKMAITHKIFNSILKYNFNFSYKYLVTEYKLNLLVSKAKCNKVHEGEGNHSQQLLLRINDQSFVS
jgi:hypothetical protein